MRVFTKHKERWLFECFVIARTRREQNVFPTRNNVRL